MTLHFFLSKKLASIFNVSMYKNVQNIFSNIECILETEFGVRSETANHILKYNKL